MGAPHLDPLASAPHSAWPGLRPALQPHEPNRVEPGPGTANDLEHPLPFHPPQLQLSLRDLIVHLAQGDETVHLPVQSLLHGDLGASLRAVVSSMDRKPIHPAPLGRRHRG